MRAPASLVFLAWLLASILGGAALAAETEGARVSADGRFTVSFREASLEEVYEMLSRQGRVNILLGKGVTGQVSVNLFDVDLDSAVRAIAAAAGYVVEHRGQTYLIMPREEAGRDAVNPNTRIQTFKVQYTEPKLVADLLEKYLSRFGKITTIGERHLIVVEDLPEFVERLRGLLAEIDVRPRQILIEAKILEISLDADQSFGIDWSNFRRFNGGDLTLGTRGLASRVSSGLFLELVSPDLDLFLNALSSKGRVRTLSTPKLLVMENEQAEVVIGDRLGFKVTTTINQVTTESIQFIESGVILKVTAAVDQAGKVLLKIHPEVSTGSVTDGIPNITTTEVTTNLLAENGQRVFIGGLIRHRDSEDRSGVPGLSDIPLLGNLFSRTERALLSTETVVIITPHIVSLEDDPVVRDSQAKIDHLERGLRLKVDRVLSRLPSVVDRRLSAPDRAPEPERRDPLQEWQSY